MSDIVPETPAPAETPATTEAPAPAAPAVEVVQQTPSSEAAASETFVEEVVEKFVDIFEAAQRLVDLVEGHRTVGDGEVAAAVADVKQAVAANAPQPATDAPAA